MWSAPAQRSKEGDAIKRGGLARSDEELRWLSELIQRQPKGKTLMQPFYTDDRLLDWDLEVAFRTNWLLAGHGSRIATPGDYFLYEIAGEQLIIARAASGPGARGGGADLSLSG